MMRLLARKCAGWVALVCIIGLLFACGKEKKQEGPVIKTVEAKPQTISTPIYFSGIIKPLNVTNVNSPIDGVVSEQMFKYGDFIKKGQELAVITSEQLEKDFLSAVSDYMKSVDAYSDKNRNYIGSEELWKLQFISQNEYYTAKNSRDEAYFSMRQSAHHLKQTLEKLGISSDRVKNIDLTDKNVIDRILTKKQDQLRVTAPASGIALFPVKAGSDGGDAEEVQQGSEIKQGQILVSIGNLDGLSVDIEVNEVDINQIAEKQKAEVTGAAFPGINLQGYVSDVNVQAKSGGSSIPTFPVTIAVPKLTNAQQKIIHVGMSAKVAISLEEENVIMIPIEAVFQENGQSMVKVKDNKSGDVKSVPVVTGKTTMDSIAITHGVKAGDTIVYNN